MQPLLLVVPAEEAGEAGAEVGAPHHPWRRNRGILQQFEVQGLQLDRGVGAEFVGQPAAELVVGRQRVGCAAGAVQGAHRQRRQVLVQRMGPGQLTRASDQVGGVGHAHPEVGLQAPLVRGQHQLVDLHGV